MSIQTLTVTPGYANGFTFSWTVAGDLRDPGPWRFTVQESHTTSDLWRDISPELVNVYAYADNVRRIPDKDAIMYFRVVLVTGTRTYYSAAVAPWGSLERREYLLARDIMRREVLHAKTLAGVLGSVWVKNVYGPRCAVCRDPITGAIRNSNCLVCFGTGYVPPYHGPYATWFTFTPNEGKLEFTEDGSGTYQDRTFKLRTIGTLPIHKGDVVMDPSQDKRYVVLQSNNLSEVRRVAVSLEVTVSEAPTTDIVYRVTQ